MRNSRREACLLLGNFQKGCHAADSALEILASLPFQHFRAKAETFTVAGKLRYAAGELEKADTLLQTAVDSYSSAPDEIHPDCISALYLLGKIARQRQDLTVAENWLGRALTLSEHARRLPDMPTAEIEQELAKIDDSRGNHVDANVYRSLAALAEAQDLLLSKRRLEPNSLWMSVPFNH